SVSRSTSPLAHCPTTVKSGSPSRHCTTPSRKIGWSSTTTTRRTRGSRTQTLSRRRVRAVNGEAPPNGGEQLTAHCRTPDSAHGSGVKLLTAPARTSYAYGLFDPQDGFPSREREVHRRAECPIARPQPRRCVRGCAVSRSEREPRHDDRPVDCRRGEGP